MGGQRGEGGWAGAGTQHRDLWQRVGALYNGQVVCTFLLHPPPRLPSTYRQTHLKQAVTALLASLSPRPRGPEEPRSAPLKKSPSIRAKRLKWRRLLTFTTLVHVLVSQAKSCSSGLGFGDAAAGVTARLNLAHC